jgi:hypothetical protein
MEDVNAETPGNYKRAKEENKMKKTLQDADDESIKREALLRIEMKRI